MKMYDVLWNDINSLLSMLRSFSAVQLVNAYYQQHSNDAPGELLQDTIDKLQKHLDESNR